MSFNLERETAINCLLYVVNRLEKADTHKTYKILYFADQKHLAKYGRPIIGDTYVKMTYGPVPSFVKNIVDEQIPGLEEVVAKYNKYYLKAIAQENLDYLSESDEECLLEAIAENKDLSFGELTDKSHDTAYEKADWQIDCLEMVKSISKDENTLNYVRNEMVNSKLKFQL